MPARFLQIRTRGRVSPRILPLSGQTVRIGRGSLCEARVDDPALADVECFLRLTGETWHLQPLSRSGRVAIDGRPVDHLRAVATNVPIRVGEATLTLRDRAEADSPFRPIEVPPAAGPGSSARVVVARDDSDDRLSDRPYFTPKPKAQDAPASNSGVARKHRSFVEPVRDVTSGPSRTNSETTTAGLKTAAIDGSLDRKTTEPVVATRRPTPAERMWQARWKAVGRALRSSGEPQVVEEPSIVPFVRTVSEPEPAFEPVQGTPDVGEMPRILDESVSPASAEVSHAFPVVESSPAIEDITASVPDPTPISVVQATVQIETSEVHWAIADSITEPVAVSFASVDAPAGDDLRSRTEVADLGTPTAQPDPPPSVDPPLLSAAPRKPRPSRPAPPRPSPRVERPVAPRPSEPVDDPEWPSVQSLLSVPRPEPVRRVPRAKKNRPQPALTTPRSPSGWSIPTWLALPACILIVGLVGSAGVFFALQWGDDGREAGLLADRLLAPGGPRAIAENDVNPDATWWKTTSGHLATKAAALGATKGSREREESSRFLLDAARVSAPLEPSTRLARAEFASRGRDSDSLPALGLSRDASSLALTARVLAKDGKNEPALTAYRSALALASQGGDARGGIPPFVDTPEAHRFALPSETLILEIVREMAGQPGWKYETWSTALPDHGLVLLATYRVLREKGDPEAESSLNRLVESPETPTSGSIGLHVAAKAEGMALKQRAEDGADLYSEAITLAGDDATRRAWHLNRALILARSGDRVKAHDAMMAARAGRGDDVIGRRVAESLKQEGLDKAIPTAAVPSPASLRTRAN